MSEPWDAIIVGQGLAGTTLAWHLIEAGQRVLVVDADEAVTSSKIAAGLITPITGQRLVLSARMAEYLPMARAFYERVEARTGARFFYVREAVRLFQSDGERAAWEKRADVPAYRSYVMERVPLIDLDVADAGGGGFAMGAAQLDVAAYLAASRQALAFEPMTLDWRRDVAFGDGVVCVRGHRARRVISCEGFGATRNPYFQRVPFQAAKGEILTTRFSHALPPVSLHRGIWIAPTVESDVFRVGSTYDWATLDQVPSAGARTELESKLRAFVRVPFEVIEHQAAVRPIVHLSDGVMGLHPEHRALGFFNGLGSKGALHAPWFARDFAAFLVRGVAVPDACDLRRVWR